MIYKCVKIKSRAEKTEKMLNELAKKGWRVVTPYSFNNDFLILEKVKGGENGGTEKSN